MAWVQEIYDILYAPDTICVASISYGKDSLAMLRAIKLLGLPLHRIVTCDVWATLNIPADLPAMYEWKKEADCIIKDIYGIEVEHIRGKQCYESMFYHVNGGGSFVGKIKGFPMTRSPWCKKLKYVDINIPEYILSTIQIDRKINIIQYLGIAADESVRIARHIGMADIVLPLVEIGWEEDLCGLISGYQNLLSPVYATATRDGCWFCHNQSIEQLRLLRKNHPDLWSLLLKWDDDSPVSFNSKGKTVHDFDARFALEDKGIVSSFDSWRWSYLGRYNEVQL